MIEGLFTNGAIGTLERLTQFTGERHRVILHNVANLSTPNFRPGDLPVSEFQKALGDAVDRRRRPGGPRGHLEMRDTPTMRFGRGFIEHRPRPARDNLMFHDRNDRSLEHQMKNLAENTMAHNAALEMLKNQFDMLRTAIRGQV